MTAIISQWETPGAVQTYLSTELNSLANAGAVLGASIDNTAGKAFINLELYLAVQGSARPDGASVRVDILPSVDGTNYNDATVPCGQQLTQLPLDAAVTARYVTRVCLPIPPTKFKLNITNRTGQAFKADSNTIKYTLHSESSV